MPAAETRLKAATTCSFATGKATIASGLAAISRSSSATCRSAENLQSTTLLTTTPQSPKVPNIPEICNGLTSALTETREMIMAERASSAQLEARVRTLENSATRQDVRFDALSLSINELKQQARETNTLLRELAQRP